MMRLGLRLAVAGGREALVRLALIAIAVAVGVALLLTTLAGMRAVHAQDARYAWFNTGASSSDAPAVDGSDPGGDGPSLWWRIRPDHFRGALVGRIDVAAVGPESPRPPGIDVLPGPGQFWASPALTRLLRTTPAAELGARYPGVQIGTIGKAGLPAPESLIIVVGRSVPDLSHDPAAVRVRRISSTPPSRCTAGCAPIGIDARGMTLVLSVVVAALLFPVLIFTGSATRLSAARREQRFAAMRLVGATPAQVSMLSTVESAVATVLGVGAGFAVFYACRPALAGIPFTGQRFFLSDLSLSLPDVLVVALGVPLAAAVAARIALRRVTISPLGVTRRVTPRPPRAWRALPLLAGLAELGYFAYLHDIGATTRTSPQVEAAAFLTGVLLTLAGLVVIGPWITRLGAALLGRRSSHPAGLLAGRRLADDPRAAFRAIGGLVVAVFIGTCALTVMATIVDYDGKAVGATTASRGTLVAQVRSDLGETSASSMAATARAVAAVKGVTGVVDIHLAPEPVERSDRRQAPLVEFVSCAELSHVPALGHCPATTEVVGIVGVDGGSPTDRSPMSGRTWLPAAMTIQQLQSLPVATVAVATDGSAAAVEGARTVLDVFDRTYAAETLPEMQSNEARRTRSYQQLADVVLGMSLPLAGCSLAVGLAGGLAERRRPFSLLRLTGTPLSVLRRVVTLETAGPLLTSAALSAGTGLLAAHLFLRAQLHETLTPPGLPYYGILLVGLGVSLAVLASTLPLLERMTGPEAARND